MIKQELIKCIKCDTGSLKFIGGEKVFRCIVCSQEYPIENNIPLLIEPDKESDLLQSEIHKRQGSGFNYKEHYKQDANDFDYFQERDSGTEHSERRVREFIFSQLPKKNKRILDVGCGKAWVAKMCCPIAEEVVSMDIAITNVKKALEKYPFKNHSGVVADSLNLPFIENSFDFIIASEIIEHVVFPDKFVANLIKALKPGGVLLVTTPYNEKLQYNLCIHCNKLTPRHAHIHSFDENVLANMYKGRENVSFEFRTFGNKVLLHLRTYVFLRFLSFRFWHLIDRMSNAVYSAPATIFVKWKKA